LGISAALTRDNTKSNSEKSKSWEALQETTLVLPKKLREGYHIHFLQWFCTANYFGWGSIDLQTDQAWKEDT
jgi:hypothetical protein